MRRRNAGAVKWCLRVLCVIVSLDIALAVSTDLQIAAKSSTTGSDRSHHRVRRRIVFSKNSKIFFRLNGKDNVIPWTQVFAHGWGFRVNYDLPDTIAKRFKFFKRDLHDEVDNLSQIPAAQQSFACIFKHVCEIVRNVNLSDACGIFCEIGNIITNYEGNEASFFKSLTAKCDLYDSLCPYSIDLYNSHIFKDNLHNIME